MTFNFPNLNLNLNLNLTKTTILNWASDSLNNIFALMINTLETFIYVINANDNGVAQITINPDGSSGSVTNWVSEIDTNLRGIAIDSTNTFVYVSDESSNKIYKIQINPDGSAGSITVWASGLYRPHGLFINSDNTYMYVCNSDTISKIQINSDGSSGVVTIWIVDFATLDMVINNSGTYAYAGNGNSIYKISINPDGTAGIPTVWASITNLASPYGIVINSTNTFIYVADFIDHKIIKVNINNDGSSGEQQVILSSLSYPRGLVINSTDTFMYLANAGNNTIVKVYVQPDGTCYNEGTKILCLNKCLEEEYIPIENLRKGDLIKTYKHGFKKINLIGKNYFLNNPNNFVNCMYKMEKTLDNGLFEDLFITGWHSVLVDDLGEHKLENDAKFTKEKETPKIDDKYLLLASVSKDFTKVETTEEFTYYHFCLESHDIDQHFGVWANGILSESTSEKNFLEHSFIL
jgi:6-phosphogluconolactonase (cycloisomerase 2 family)